MTRYYRELSPDVKQRISAAMAGKPKSAVHKEHLSTALKNYWSTIPSRVSGNNKQDNSGSDGENL